jgi:hypothetical protein
VLLLVLEDRLCLFLINISLLLKFALNLVDLKVLVPAKLSQILNVLIRIAQLLLEVCNLLLLIIHDHQLGVNVLGWDV